MLQFSITKVKPSDIWQFPGDPTLSCVYCNSVSPCLGNGLDAHLSSFAEKAATSWDLGVGLGHKAGQRVYWSPWRPKGCYAWDCPLGSGFPVAWSLDVPVGLSDVFTFLCLPICLCWKPTPYPTALCLASECFYFSPSLNRYQCKVNKHGYFSSFPGCFISLHTAQHSRAPQQGTPGTMELLVVKGVTRWCKYVLI